MQFKNISLALISENAEGKRNQYKKLSEITTQEDLNNFLKWSYNKRLPYKGSLEEQKEKAKSLIDNEYKKSLLLKMQELRAIEEAQDFNNEFIINIRWVKSRMWGNNPTASTNCGFNGSSIGGCGYDKKSTATAQALNSNLSILKLLCKIKEKNINDKSNRDFLGYGLGYNILPKFEGGVGVECHLRILNKLGLYAKNVIDKKNIDVYLIRVMTKGEKAKYKKDGYI